jgi:hypothetical protein
VFVGVGEPVAPSVGFDNLPKGEGVHLFTVSGQVSGYVHAPQLALWQAANGFNQSF